LPFFVDRATPAFLPSNFTFLRRSTPGRGGADPVAVGENSPQVMRENLANFQVITNKYLGFCNP
jgi:hypothetical protein